MGKTKAVIYDMDGTLCDVRSIRHHVLSKRKNFYAMTYLSLFCPTNPEVVDALRRDHEAGLTIIVVTARMDKWSTLTLNWLHHHDIPFDELHMRRTDDIRKDYVVKEEILLRLQERYEIIHAHDDNPAVIELWQRYNIPTTIIPGWYEPEEALEYQPR